MGTEVSGDERLRSAAADASGDGHSRPPIVPSLERVFDGRPASIDGAEPEEAPAAEPRLRVPEALTPLPAVDEALPMLRLFGGVLGRRRERYKVALLKTLQSDGSGRWKIRALQEVVHWLEPPSVTALVGELKAAGVLVQEPRTGHYRLTSEARVVTALLDALTVPGIEPRRLIRCINEAMSFAIAAGASEDVLVRQFASAVAILRGDYEELKALLEDYSPDALLVAAERVRDHVNDMRDLLERHEAFLAQHRYDALFLQQDQEALELVPKLAQLSAEVIDALTGRADERLRAGMRIDRNDLREFLAETAEEELAALVEGLALPAPFVCWVPADAAFDALEQAAGRERAVPPPLPKPRTLVRERPRPQSEPAHAIAGELEALESETTVAEVVVQESWVTSIGRHVALIDAYSRFADRLPKLDHDQQVDELNRDGVWRASRTRVRPRT